MSGHADSQSRPAVGAQSPEDVLRCVIEKLGKSHVAKHLLNRQQSTGLDRKQVAERLDGWCFGRWPFGDLTTIARLERAELGTNSLGRVLAHLAEVDDENEPIGPTVQETANEVLAAIAGAVSTVASTPEVVNSRTRQRQKGR